MQALELRKLDYRPVENAQSHPRIPHLLVYCRGHLNIFLGLVG